MFTFFLKRSDTRYYIIYSIINITRFDWLSITSAGTSLLAAAYPEDSWRMFYFFMVFLFKLKGN